MHNMASSKEPLYCICRKPYVKKEFMIQCDQCEGWFHGRCVKVTPDQGDDIYRYHCPSCQKTHGPIVWKQRSLKSAYTPDGMPIQHGIMKLVTELKHRNLPSGDDVVLRLGGRDLTSYYLAKNGFKRPILVDRKDGLDLRVPPPTFSVEDVEEKVGSDFVFPVIDVMNQEDRTMRMDEWREYYNCPGHTEILNTISLEFSQTPMSEMVEPPLVVRQLSWVNTLWPEDAKLDEVSPERPNVQKYCLMGVKDSFTNFHIDFGGTSVWYHVLKGEKVFFLIEPTETNLQRFETWMSSPMPHETFFGDYVECCWRLVVKAGQTLFIPTAWIHAVYTPIDSIVFGGNFLHSLNVPLQLEAYEMERRVKPPEKYMFPSYDTINWLAAKEILDILQACSDGSNAPEPFIIEAGGALAQHLKKWTQRKELNNKLFFPKKGANAVIEMEGIQYGKLLKQLNSELKKFKTVDSPAKAKSEKKSGKRRKKKEQVKPDPMQVSLHLLHQQTQEKLKAADTERRMNVYSFEDEEEAAPSPTVLKVRLPKPGTSVEKRQEQKVPPIKLWAMDVEPKKSKRRKGSSKKSKKEVKSPKAEVTPAPTPPTTTGDLRLLFTKRKVAPPSEVAVDGDNGDGQHSFPLQGSLGAGGSEEDSDKDTLVVDETPRRKPAPFKQETVFKNLSQSLQKAASQPVAVESRSVWGQESSSSVGSGSSTIADILRVTAQDYSTQEGLTMSTTTTSSAQMMAAEGMLSMSQGRHSMSGLERLSQGITMTSQPGTQARDEEQQLMDDCYHEGDYVYPSFELEEEERLGGRVARLQDRDDNWNPKARVSVPSKTEERSQRLGARNPAVASGLAATAKKLSYQSSSILTKPARKSLVKSRLTEDLTTSPTPGSSSALLPGGLKRPVDRTVSTPEPKSKKPKKGMATAKQRLSKILKMRNPR